MTSLKINILYGMLITALILMVFVGTKAYIEALEYEETTVELVSLQGAQEQALLKIEKIATSILGTFAGNKRQDNFEKVEKKRRLAMHNAQKYTRYFIYLLFVVFVSYFFISLQMFTMFGSIAAIITLTLGLIVPILMVTIHTKVEYLGDIVLSFESKGVVGSIFKLFNNGDVIVASVILIFSVLIPLMKVFALLLVSVLRKSRFSHNIVNFFKLIGKWSMVDVFVVSVFLVYLTANKGGASRAEIEVGLYFFLAYVITSMLLSFSAEKMLR